MKFLIVSMLVMVSSMFTTKTDYVKKDAVQCYIYKADISSSAWSRLTTGTSYTSYVIPVLDPNGSNSVFSSDFNDSADYDDLLDCLGVLGSPTSIIVEDELEGF